MVFKVMYKFFDDDTMYVYYMTHTLYANFKTLLAVESLIILQRNHFEMQEYEDEMQRSIDEAFANSTFHIKRLSEEL